MSAAQKNGTEANWESVAEESATNVVMEPGDTYTGIYQGRETIAPDDHEPFDVLVFITLPPLPEGLEEGERVSISPSYKLNEAFRKVNEGDTVRVTCVKEIETKKGLNPMKDYTVQVRRA